jgi:hypothetical protein
MINRTIRLQLGEERVKALKEYNRKVLRHLEKKMPLNLAVLEDLENALSEVVQGSTGWVNFSCNFSSMSFFTFSPFLQLFEPKVGKLVHPFQGRGLKEHGVKRAGKSNFSKTFSPRG